MSKHGIRRALTRPRNVAGVSVLTLTALVGGSTAVGWGATAPIADTVGHTFTGWRHSGSHTATSGHRRHHHHHQSSTTSAPAPAEPTTSAPAPAEPTTSAPAPAEPTTSAPAPAEPTTSAPAPAEPTTSAPASGTGGAAPTGVPQSGVPAGTQLQPSGGITVTQAGTVIDGRDVSGPIKVRANNVTIRNSRVTDGGWTVIDVAQGVTGTRIENVEVDGRGYNGSPGAVGIAGSATIVHTDIHGVENGIIPGDGSVVRESWIHQLESPGGDPHYDGFQLDGGQNDVLIENNTVDLTNQDRTSTVMIDNDFGPIKTITVRANRLLGGSFTVYADGKFSSDPITGVSYVDNRMGMGGYGYGLIRNASVTWSGNVDDKTGNTVTP